MNVYFYFLGFIERDPVDTNRAWCNACHKSLEPKFSTLKKHVESLRHSFVANPTQKPQQRSIKSLNEERLESIKRRGLALQPKPYVRRKKNFHQKKSLIDPSKINFTTMPAAVFGE